MFKKDEALFSLVKTGPGAASVRNKRVPVGRAIALARTAFGLSAAEVAKGMGTTRVALAKIEGGLRLATQREVTEALAAIGRLAIERVTVEGVVAAPPHQRLAQQQRVAAR